MVVGELGVDLWQGNSELVQAGDVTTNPEGRVPVLRLARPAGSDEHSGVTLRYPKTIGVEAVHSFAVDSLSDGS